MRARCGLSNDRRPKRADLRAQVLLATAGQCAKRSRRDGPTTSSTPRRDEDRSCPAPALGDQLPDADAAGLLQPLEHRAAGEAEELRDAAVGFEADLELDAVFVKEEPLSDLRRERLGEDLERLPDAILRARRLVRAERFLRDGGAGLYISPEPSSRSCVSWSHASAKRSRPCSRRNRSAREPSRAPTSSRRCSAIGERIPDGRA